MSEVQEEKRTAEIKHLKPGGFVLIDDVVCKVERIQISKPGKHGESKVRLTATGVFTDKKVAIVHPAGEKMKVPIIEKRDAQVVAIHGDTVQLMDMQDYNMFDVSIPEEFKGKLVEGKEIMIWRFGPNAMIKGLK